MKQIAGSIKALLRQPRYTVLAVVTLAGGIGANAAMFGLLDAVYFRPLPLTTPDALVEVTLVSPGNRFSMLSYEEFRDLERSIAAFEDVMAIGRRGVTLDRNGQTEALLIHYVSGRYFPSLGIPMQLGRGFAPPDDDRGVSPQVVINHQLWEERLGSPPDIIGRPIQLNGRPFTVIGVTARGFAGLQRTVRTDVWVTAAQAPLVAAGLGSELEDRRHRWFSVIGRLKRGVDVREAAMELDLLLARWRSSGSTAAPDYQDARLVARPQADANRDAQAEGAVFLVLVGLVLFVACANVANLTLARSEGRRREMAVRAALGASRLALVGQTVLESAIVAAAGTAVGVLVASWVVRIVPALLPPGTSSIVIDIRMDARLLAFAALLAVVTTALVGAAAAWRASRADVASGLKAHAATTTASGRVLSLRDLLVVGELALSAVIVIAACLAVRSFAHSLGVDAGFDSRKNVATFYVVPGLKGYDTGATYRFLDESRRAVAALPGVARASYAIRLPAQGNEAGWAASFVIPGKEPPPGRDAFEIRYTMVGPDYFEVMGTRILSGRGIGAEDRPDSAPVAIVSESMARRLWPGESPLGRRIRMGRLRPVDREIVGVAQDIRIGGLYEPHEMYVYVPFAQHAQSFGLLLVETENDAASIASAVRQRLAEIDPELPILTVSSFADHMDRLLFEDRRNAWVALAVALLAVTLAAVGVYGVVSLVAARRRKEIGIRTMLGARRADLVRTLLARSVRLALAGTALGVAGGMAGGRLLESQLHGVDSLDPVSYVVGALVCVSVALAASVAPVWRAIRLDPAVALRDE
jgi:predicted permease